MYCRQPPIVPLPVSIHENEVYWFDNIPGRGTVVVVRDFSPDLLKREFGEGRKVIATSRGLMEIVSIEADRGPEIGLVVKKL